LVVAEAGAHGEPYDTDVLVGVPTNPPGYMQQYFANRRKAKCCVLCGKPSPIFSRCDDCRLLWSYRGQIHTVSISFTSSSHTTVVSSVSVDV